MNLKDRILITRYGKFALLLAGMFLFLGAMNLKSHIQYGGRDYRFLFWIAAYFSVMGIGLIRLRKWALLLLFLPAFVDVTLFILDYRDVAHGVPIGSTILNLCLLAVFTAIPVNGLLFWRELTWKL